MRGMMIVAMVSQPPISKMGWEAMARPATTVATQLLLSTRNINRPTPAAGTSQHV
jgi:hypothetical protein